MKLPRLTRYQLRKEAVGVVLRNAPWIFRDHLSSAAEVFEDGQWLRLVDGKNRVLGYGMYEARGAIAIRVLRRNAGGASGTSETPPDGAWVIRQVDAALAKRAPLREGASATDAFRAIHGESDGLPAVVVDVFGHTLVVQSYAAGADALARLCARLVARRLGNITHIVQKGARRRPGAPATAPEPPRLLLGGGSASSSGTASASSPSPLSSPIPSPITFHEGALEFVCDPLGGQKSGTFLDLRGLRRAVAAMSLRGARVLNLFSYTGMLGRAAERAGAKEIWQVDASAAALALAAQHHVDDAARHKLIEADVFSWLPAQPAPMGGGAFQLVIVDPPAMISRRAQAMGALAGYRKLYRAAAPHVAPGGTLFAVCCTSRITREEFRQVVTASLGQGFEPTGEIPPEVDHPVTFPEADYLKVLSFRRRVESGHPLLGR